MTRDRQKLLLNSIEKHIRFLTDEKFETIF